MHDNHPLQVILMVHELHKLGYQRMRIAPGMSASGMHWRCAVTHLGNIQRTHGAKACRDNGMANRPDGESAFYTSGQGNEYFGWKDSKEDTPRQLADKFIARFPRLANLACGQDWAYAGWFVLMLGLAEKGFGPVAYADWYETPDPRWLPTTGDDTRLPMPPGGEGGADTESGESIGVG